MATVVTKLDWFQAVFNNVNFDYILNDFLELDLPSFDDVYASMFERPLGYDTHVGFAFNGIMLSTRVQNIITADDSQTVFTAYYDSIQLQVSGSGLDYLRSIGKNVDTLVRRPPDLDDSGIPLWHVTRCDFAFDFVNYDFDLYQSCKQFLESEYSGLTSVKLSGVGRPVNYSIRSGGERTIYVGAPRSDKLLRIYDKKLEQSDKSGLLKSTPCDGDINSWIRLEFQTRNKIAHNLLFGSTSYLDILKYLFENYSFLDRAGKRAEFWINLFDWDSIPNIIQNANWAQPVLTKNSILRSVQRSLCNLVAFYISCGSEEFKKLLTVFMSSTYLSDQTGSFRSRGLANKVYLLSDGASFDSLPGADIININGHQSFKLKGGFSFED